MSILLTFSVGFSISLINNPELNYVDQAEWSTSCCSSTGTCPSASCFACALNSCGWAYSNEMEIGFGGIGCQGSFGVNNYSYVRQSLKNSSANATLTFSAYYSSVSAKISNRSIFNNLTLTSYPYHTYTYNIGSVTAGEVLEFFVNDSSTCKSNPHFDYIRLTGDILGNETNVSTCEPAWYCVDSDTKIYQLLNCSLSNQTDCTGGTPYCIGGDCVSGCTRGYTCIDGVTQAFVDELCVQSETVNCNSTGYGYCYGGRCYEELRPAFDENATTLDIIETTTMGIKGMLRWLSPPLFYILMAIAVTILIMGIFGLLVALANKVGR